MCSPTRRPRRQLAFMLATPRSPCGAARMPMDRPLKEFTHMINAANRIALFTGAGISTESGIPDFRSPGGIWIKQVHIVFSDFMRSDEARRQTWRRRFAIDPILRQATPNRG